MHTCSGNLCTKFHTLSFINNREISGVLLIAFSSFVVKLSILASIILHMICYQAFSLWFGFINMCSFLEVMRWIMSYRPSLGKYIDSTTLMALPALTWVFEWRQNSWDLVLLISHALRISVHLAVQWCPLSCKFQLRKKDIMFLKRLQSFFNLFVRKKGNLYFITKGAFSYLLNSY